MPDSTATPFGNFHYDLLFSSSPLDGSAASDRNIADGAFAECSGLEATMEPKVIKEGGQNYGTHVRAGTVTFATVILRRGMTFNTDLWKWFEAVTLRNGYTNRMDVTIRHVDFSTKEVIRSWQLSKALPVKFKSSDLNAKGAEIAIEELHLVHEGLQLL